VSKAESLKNEPVVSRSTGIRQYFNKWRLILLVFIVAYGIIVSIDLGYMAIQWDETPHLLAGLLLSKGRIQQYLPVGAFYPPTYDVMTTFYFLILGATTFASRLVAVTFGLLSIWIIFEYAYRLYGPREALVAGILLALMPGFVYMCRMTLIETMLMFFFSASLLMFFLSLRTGSKKMLVLSGAAMGLAILTKYQAVFIGLIMLVSILLLHRERIAGKLGKFLLVAIVASAIFLPWIFFLASQNYADEMLGNWFYAAQVGNEERQLYSTRFPVPIFYLIEITYPYLHVHPVSLAVYLFALAGIGLFLWRRKKEDIFTLLWFLIIYLVFTIIPNRNWRYVSPALPALAVFASVFIFSAWDRIKQVAKLPNLSLRRRNAAEFTAIIFVVLVLAAAAFSSWDSYLWAKAYHVSVPVEEASRYVAEQAGSNSTVAILCATSMFNIDMVKFGMIKHGFDDITLWQYPALPVDVYKPNFNLTELIETAEHRNITYFMLDEYGNLPYYDSELTYHKVYEGMYNSGRFVHETTFGVPKNEIFIISFTSNATLTING
jgi:predicted membrane-bound mannosyltransferase